ncbi:MAG: NapC/NirT family cytochrome c [Blastocatellia bacterium]|nr:NapC/NirT family cytochrome c [Blastocatellia bacterium]
MFTPITALIAIIALSIVLIAILIIHPSVTATRGGKILAFVAILILPIVSGGFGVSEHLQRSKTTEFCLSCHVMEDYGKSLHIDDKSFIPAVHYQNGLVPREQACFTCHTDYTMYGDFNAKLRGLKHVYVQYLGKPAQPIKLYQPYNNRECLHCHQNSRSYLENETHTKEPDRLEKMKTNQLSCSTTDCHNIVHRVDQLKDQTFWKEAGK